MLWLNVAVVALLVVLEALFVAAEIALVSLRDGQVRAFAEGSRRTRRIAELVRDPNRFLGAVQIGVTTTAILISAFGEASFGDPVGSGLQRLGLPERWAHAVGFALVVAVISFVTILLGELVPKRLALQRTEAAARLLGPPLDRVARMARPVIWLLSKSTDVLVRLFGGDPSVGREAISEEELRDLVVAHESLSSDERQLISEVFAAGERQIREVMVPRTEVDFLDAGLSVPRAAALASSSSHSRFPVYRDSQDDIVGFVHVRDLFAASEARAGAARLGDLARPIALLPDSRTVLAALSDLRRENAHIAVVVDEYGGTAGIVTLEDLIEELVGEISDEYDEGRRTATRLRGGDLEVDALLNLDEFAEATGLKLPDGPYETVAGYVLASLGRLPSVGDTVEAEGCRLAVTEMDGRRISRVRVTPPASVPAGAAPETGYPA